MAKNALTKTAAEALKPRDKAYSVPAGVPGLSLIVHPSGRKSWSLFYRVGPTPRRLNVGTFPTILPDAARKLAQKNLNRVADGRDPAAEKKDARKPTDTVASVAAEFVKKHGEARGLRTWQEIDRVLRKLVIPKLGKKPFQSVTRREIVALLDDIAAHHGPIAANRALAHVRKLFRWALARDLIDSLPVAGIQPPGKEKKRQRVLTDGELAEVWAAAGSLPHPYGGVARALILTGCRTCELGGMHVAEFGKDDLWTISSDRVKNALPHLIPMPPLLVTLLDSLPRLANGHVFANGVPGRKGPYKGEIDRPFSDFKGVKDKLDKAITDTRRKAAEARGDDPEKVEAMPHFVLHDLRRTMRTGLSRLGVDPEIAERCIGHLPPGIRGVYDLYAFLPEKRAAFRAWAEHVAAIVAPQKSEQEAPAKAA